MASPDDTSVYARVYLSQQPQEHTLFPQTAPPPLTSLSPSIAPSPLPGVSDTWVPSLEPIGFHTSGSEPDRERSGFVENPTGKVFQFYLNPIVMKMLSYPCSKGIWGGWGVSWEGCVHEMVT